MQLKGMQCIKKSVLQINLNSFLLIKKRFFNNQKKGDLLRSPKE